MSRSNTAYLVLADALEDTLADLDPGSRLPSENELGPSFGVSRITARAALRELEQRHLVRRIRGSGTFVGLRIDYPLRSEPLPSWSEIVTRAGHRASYDVDVVASERSSAKVAQRLDIPRGRMVTRAVRRGRIDGNIASHHSMYVPSGLVPGIGAHLRRGGSAARILDEHYGLRPRRWWSRAELISAPDSIAMALDLVGRPLAWHTQSINRCPETGTAVEYSEGWLRPDCFRVYLELGPAEQ